MTAQSLLIERLYGRVRPSGDCLLWTGATAGKNYGRLEVSGKPRYAHRLAYELAFGEIPAGLSVCHRCDVPRCINPDHLFLGTAKDNCADSIAKGRRPQMAGSKPKFDRNRMRALKASGLSIKEVAQEMGCGTASVCVALYGLPPSKQRHDSPTVVAQPSRVAGVR